MGNGSFVPTSQPMALNVEVAEFKFDAPAFMPAQSVPAPVASAPLETSANVFANVNVNNAPEFKDFNIKLALNSESFTPFES